MKEVDKKKILEKILDIDRGIWKYLSIVKKRFENT